MVSGALQFPPVAVDLDKPIDGPCDDNRERERADQVRGKDAGHLWPAFQSS